MILIDSNINNNNNHMESQHNIVTIAAFSRQPEYLKRYLLYVPTPAVGSTLRPDPLHRAAPRTEALRARGMYLHKGGSGPFS